ncbi:LysR family transcriptional regulator [Bacillus bingmayongensis]|uniref:LysR family transcriptional regulator n=1 Tax=Bacillus bingmayongensis TaxID=1150157 RepID=UPI0002E7070E|nr:LysR family transcriptional regulator [Bacillus bingmayongensis]
MNIEQLQYIIKVAETRSISSSSEILHISQAGISMAITNLEKELGIKIFKRSRTGTIPTKEGKEIIQKAYEVVSKLQEIRDKAQTYADTMEKELRLSSTQGLFLTILPKALALFKKKYPNVNVIIEEKGGHYVIDDVIKSKVDIGLMHIPKKKPKEEELDFQILLKGKLIVTVSRHSPLVNRKNVTPQDLLEQNLVVYNGPNMHTFIRYFFNRFGKMNILFSTNNTEIMKKTVAEGLAIAFSYDVGINTDPYYLSGELVPIPLINMEHNSLDMGWVQSRKHCLSKAAKEFIKCLELYASTYKY